MSLVPPRSLFRIALACRSVENLAGVLESGLDESYRLPCLAPLDGFEPFADLRLAWHPQGLALDLYVSGKQQRPWCRANRLEDSDGLQVWIDTRGTTNIHRASRFCHRFILLPGGQGVRGDEPVADQLLINRARENAKPVRPGVLDARSWIERDSYSLQAVLPAKALTGWDPREHRQIGFNYLVADRELGAQTLSVGGPLPYQEDPSLWAALDLVEAE